MDYVVSPQNSHVEILNSTILECECIWRQDVWRGNNRVNPKLVWLTSLQEESRMRKCTEGKPCEDTEKIDFYKPWKETSEETNSANTFTLDLSVKDWKKINSCCLCHPAYSTLLRWPQRTNTQHDMKPWDVEGSRHF